MNHKVLFIDDEERILQSLKRLFRTSEYNMYYFSSGSEGLEFLNQNQVSVIVSDMKMPEMNGVEFLEAAMKICPEAVRIILSGYSEADQIMDAINKGNIWRFIPKPWNNDDIRITIRNAVELFQKNREKEELTERLKQKTSELDLLNKELESRVEERTWHLNERNRLLNMMLDDVDADTILRQIAMTISRILKEAEVYIRSCFLDKLYSSVTDEIKDLPPDILNLESEVLRRNKNFTKNGYTAVLLKKTEKKLGVLLIKTKDEGEHSEIERKIAGFTSLLDIVLFQSNLLMSTPGLLKDIDKIIGSI